MQVVGHAVSIFGLYLVYSVTFGDAGRHVHGIHWGIFLFGFFVAFAGQWLTTFAMKGDQRENDGGSRRAFVSERTSEFSDSALFLRPFDISGKFLLKRPPVNAFDLEQYTHPGTDALERFLAEAFAGTLKFVGLGGRGDVEFGLASGGLVEDWQKKVQIAMDGAAYVLIVPASNPSTLWEIGQAKERGHLAKTMFIMPASVHPFEYTGEGKYSQRWSAACIACADAYGLQLPPYDDKGLLFRFSPPSMTRRDARFALDSPRSLAQSVNNLFG